MRIWGFLAVRSRPNTVAAVAYDLKVFFAVVGKPPRRVVAADVLAFVTALGAHRHKVAQAWADHLNELIQHHKRPDDVGRKTE